MISKGKTTELNKIKLLQFAIFALATSKILTQSILGPSLPLIERAFSHIVDIDYYSRLILSLPSLFIVIFSPIAGALMDKYSRLSFVLPMLLLWSLAGVSGYFIDDIYLLLVSRAVFGIATAFVMVGAFALLDDLVVVDSRFPRDSMLSGLGVFMGIAGVLSALSGGYMATISYKAAFLVHLLGFLLLALSIALLPMLRNIENRSSTDASGESSSNLFMLLFVCGTTFVAILLYFTSPTQLPFLIINALGLKPYFVGISTLFLFLSFGVFSYFYAYLRRYFSVYGVWALSFLLMGLAFIVVNFATSHLVVLLAQVMTGASGALMVANGAAWLFASSTTSSKARDFGYLSSSAFLGQFLSPFVSQTIVRVYGFEFVFAVIGAALIALGAIYLSIGQIIKIKNRRKFCKY